MQFRDLVDLGELQSLCESLTELTGITTAILDLDGNILVATGWQTICTCFHRLHPTTSERCRESDTVLASQLQQGQTYNVYRCKNGLVDVAVPILIEGEHVANFFIGQFFLEPPDEDFFRRQAAQIGFDETAYLAALAKVPVYSAEKVEMLMAFLSRLARIMGEMGLARIRVESTNARLQEYQEHLEDLVRERTADLSRAQQAAHEARERAEAANRAKSAFLAAMSHELRTPLSVILGFSRLLKAAPQIDAAQAENLDIIVRSGEHLSNLINNVLDVSKIEAGHTVIEKSSFDLHQLLWTVQSLMQAQAREKGLELVVEQAPDLPRYVVTDEGKLRQVLINLVGNAVKYTLRGRVVLRMGTVPSDDDSTLRLRVEVEDSGIGIAEEDCQRLFMPFVQLERRPAAVPGTGLGLAISKQYVELMGGQIGVTSRPDHGSRFYFEIPVSVAPAAETSVAPVRSRAVGLVPGHPCYRLLIAEDQPENRLLLVRLLEPFGFELREAANGAEAVEIWRTWHPHLIWMDVRMPGMDGMEATRRIKASVLGPMPKIVALTAHALEDERREILVAGCDDVVRKPYRASEIFDALTKHLGVQFVYADDEQPVAPVLDLSTLKDLPAAWLKELKEAAELLDGQRCLAVADRIRPSDDKAAEAIAKIVDGFQYRKVLEILDSLETTER